MAADFFFGLVAVFRVLETGLLDIGGGAGRSRIAEGEGILIVSITIKYSLAPTCEKSKYR